LVAGHRIEPLLHNLPELFGVGDPLHMPPKTEVFGQFRFAYRLAKQRPLPVGACDDQDWIWFSAEDTDGTDQIMMRAVAIRPHGTMTRAKELDGRVVIAEVAVEQRGFHVLTAAGAFAMQQCKANCGRGVGASTDIPDAHLRNDGRTVSITEHIE